MCSLFNPHNHPVTFRGEFLTHRRVILDRYMQVTKRRLEFKALESQRNDLLQEGCKV